MCKSYPTAKKVFDNSCIKEATKWIINNTVFRNPVAGNAQMTAMVVAQDKNGATPISQKVMDASDAISLFFYNLSLTTSLDVPEISDFSDSE